MFQSNKIDLGVFCEKLSFDSLFSSEFQVFLVGFLCVLKMYHARLFIVEKMGFGMAPKQCGVHSKPLLLLQKTCISYASETLAVYVEMCLHTHALAYVHRPRPTYTGRGPLWSFYFQKQIFAHLKGYIFHFSTSQVNLISYQALSWCWALQFEHHQGTGALVIRGTKCGVYTQHAKHVEDFSTWLEECPSQIKHMCAHDVLSLSHSE